MNRPDRKDYVVVEWTGEKSYISDLEKYCDELEKKLAQIKANGLFKQVVALEQELLECCTENEYNKRALDRACAILSSEDKYYECAVMTLDNEELECDVEWDSKKWKEFLLEDR